MERVYFEIAKKMEKLGVIQGGVRLSSLKGDPVNGVSMVLVASDLSGVREEVSAYRTLHGVPLNFRSRGKSLEVFSPGLAVLCGFAKGISFNPDDAGDVMEFCSGVEDLYPGLSFEDIRLDRDSMSLHLSWLPQEGLSLRGLYDALDPVLAKYGMGIIKPAETGETGDPGDIGQ